MQAESFLSACGTAGHPVKSAHADAADVAREPERVATPRVTWVMSAVAVGRIPNTKTGHSQIMAGVVWGIGMALHEETVMDQRFGRIMNANIAEYHNPVNADIHDIDVIFVEEQDERINKLGVMGRGEIGMVGLRPSPAASLP
nr:molybdopterin cofactor-binding domain-containing protein [Bradyrhizobium diazoefficiens]